MNCTGFMALNQEDQTGAMDATTAAGAMAPGEVATDAWPLIRSPTTGPRTTCGDGRDDARHGALIHPPPTAARGSARDRSPLFAEVALDAS